MAQLKITLKKSLIGRQKDQIATANSLGLTIQTQGKINKIRHLVEVTEA